MDKFIEFIGWCGELDVQAVTCWLLSKENLSRPESELTPYFDVLGHLFDRLPESPGAQGVKIKAIGSLSLLPDGSAGLDGADGRAQQRRRSPVDHRRGLRGTTGDRRCLPRSDR